MLRRSAALGFVVLAVAACQPTTAAKPSPSRAPSPSLPALSPASPTASPTPGPLLFAVLEARGRGSRYAPDSEPGVDSSYDTVAIVGLDGYARAKVTFAPRQVPFVGEAAPVLGIPAQAADGAVYFLDGKGVVRRLAPSGSLTEVADFPTGAQQEERFAVSPDGLQVVASRLSLPPEMATPGGPPQFAPGAHMHLQLMKAGAGDLTPTTIANQDLGPAGITATVVAGWDQSGPLVLTGADLGTQAQTDSAPLLGRHLQRLDLTNGAATAVVGGSTCSPWTELVDGTTLCWGTKVEVRNQAGTVLWSAAGPPQGTPSGFALSPDGQHVTVASYGSYSTVVVAGADGSSVNLASHFVPEGWLDDSTLIGYTAADANGSLAGAHLGLVRLASPGSVVDLGFKGVFVGVVRP